MFFVSTISWTLCNAKSQDKNISQWRISLHGFHAHLSNQGERCQSQYTFVNPLEIEGDWFTDTRFAKKYMSHGSTLKKYWF